MFNSLWSASLGCAIAVDGPLPRSWAGVVIGAGLLGIIGGPGTSVWATPDPANGKPILADSPIQPMRGDAAIRASSPTQRVIRVDPVRGDDARGQGDAQLPFRTITHALQVATPDTVIRLEAGTYSVDSGEVFPLRLKPGVIVQGDVETRGQAIVVRGGGAYGSAIAASPNVTVVGASRAALVGVTITNPQPQGYGLWIESTQPTVLSNTFTANSQAGIALQGTASPLISNNFFYANRNSGLMVHGTARPRIQDNVFEQMAIAIHIDQAAAPLMIGNRLTENEQGIVVQDTARPILRGNSVERNQKGGMIIAAQAQPDLGTIASPGGNWFRNNGQFDLNNQSNGGPIAAFGNEITTLLGRVEVTGTQPVSGSASGEQLALAPTIAPGSANLAPTPTGSLISAKSFPAPVLPAAAVRSPLRTPARPSALPSIAPTERATARFEGVAIVPTAIVPTATPSRPPMLATAATGGSAAGISTTRPALRGTDPPTIRTPAIGPSAIVRSEIEAPKVSSSVLRVPTPTSPVPIAVPPPDSQSSVTVNRPSSERVTVMSLDLSRSAIAPRPLAPRPLAPRPLAPRPLAPRPVSLNGAPPRTIAPLALTTVPNSAPNLLPVPDPNAPIGNVGSSPQSFVYRGPQRSQGFPNGRSRALELGYRYRVYVEKVAPDQEAQIRALAPDAFYTQAQGRSILQIGLFQDRSGADALVQTLSRQGIMAIAEVLQ